jgi:hypothetical protein
VEPQVVKHCLASSSRVERVGSTGEVSGTARGRARERGVMRRRRVERSFMMGGGDGAEFSWKMAVVIDGQTDRQRDAGRHS